MRLKEIIEANFRCSELTMYTEWSKGKDTLGANELLLFVSKRGDQLVFVSRFLEVRTGNEGSPTKKVLASRRLRVPGGRWNPLMLVNYAEEAGVKIEGLRRFEDFYKNL